MKNKATFLYNHLLGKIRIKCGNYKNSESLMNRVYAGDEVNKSAKEINEYIYEKLSSGEPFLAGRFGATELSAVKFFDFEVESKYEKITSQLNMWSGFFPKDKNAVMKFKDLMLKSIPKADVMAVWSIPFEDYYLNKYGKKDLKTTSLFDIEPWKNPELPWSAALKGKKVLVIHPFENTIKSQYQKREKIFPNTQILPEFELKTLKAVQTIAGEEDSRFDSWFDALDWMYNEAIKMDFDIAVIGCGAYGFPLAAKLKGAGKQAIHLGGATQLLFGIKGKRWEEVDCFDYVRELFNDAWVNPSDEDKPKQAKKVEGGCYW